MACWYDLNSAQPQLKFIPRVSQTGLNYVGIPLDSAAGWVVGTEDWDLPFLYKMSSGAAENLADYFDPQWTPSQALGVNEQEQIIGIGSMDYSGPGALNRGWLLDLKEPPVPPHKRLPALVMQILFGVTTDGGGLGYIGRKPIPIDPWGPRLSANTRDILAGLAIGELAALLSDPNLQQVIRRAEVDLLEEVLRKMKQGNQSAQGES